MAIILDANSISLFQLDVTIENESDWAKIDAAIDNIRIGDIKNTFSLPIEISEILDRAPRKVLSAEKGYSIDISLKKIILRFSTKKFGTIPLVKEETEIAKILTESESSFNLIYGIFLTSRTKPEKINVKWRIRFNFPLKEKIVQNTVDNSFMEKLAKYDHSGTYSIVETLISKSLLDGKITFEMNEDEDDDECDVEITKNFKSNLTAVNISQLIDESIKFGNDIISLIRG
jgi:hypothetical protein